MKGLDRVAIGTLAPGIRRDLGLTAVEMGWIFTAFQLAYGHSVAWFGNWDLPLYVMGGLFLIGAVCWGLIDPRQPVFAADPLPAANLQRRQ